MIREVDPHVLRYFHLDEAALRELTEQLLRSRLEIESFASNIASA